MYPKFLGTYTFFSSPHTILISSKMWFITIHEPTTVIIKYTLVIVDKQCIWSIKLLKGFAPHVLNEEYNMNLAVP